MTEVEKLIDRLSEYEDKKTRERFMKHWDGWRSDIATGRSGSAPRDGFESWVDEWWDDAKEAATTIRSLVADVAWLQRQSNGLVEMTARAEKAEAEVDEFNEANRMLAQVCDKRRDEIARLREALETINSQGTLWARHIARAALSNNKGCP